MTANPITGIKRLQEQRRSDIVYCTPEERAEIISPAQQIGWQEWLAVPVAFFSGMRREEVANLKWEDVRLKGGAIFVAKTKTQTSRTLPLNSTFKEYLLAIPEEQRKGYVVPVRTGFQRVSRLNTLMRKIRKLKTERIICVIHRHRFNRRCSISFL